MLGPFSKIRVKMQVQASAQVPALIVVIGLVTVVSSLLPSLPSYASRAKLLTGAAPKSRETPTSASPEKSGERKKMSTQEKQSKIEKLTPLQRQVTQENGTERPFANAYWDNHEAGIYVDVVSGEPLFSSLDKYDSGTGWPSFSKPLVEENVKFKSDHELGDVRTEVRSMQGDSHLGHIFDDGPPSTGKRYCMNSASLRFIAAKDLEKEGYGQFKKLFEKK